MKQLTNLEIVQKSYECGKNGDVPGMVADLSPTGTWTEMAGAPYPGTYVGPQAVIENVLGPMNRDWEPFACAPGEFLAMGDTVLMLGDYFGKHKETGKEFKVRVAHVWKLKDGKIVSFEQFTDTLLIAEVMQ